MLEAYEIMSLSEEKIKELSGKRVLTEKEVALLGGAKAALPACGLEPIVVLSVRIPNQLYQNLTNECELAGFNSIAEYLKQSAREKLERDERARAETLKLQTDAYR